MVQLILYYFVSDDPVIWHNSEPSIFFYTTLFLFSIFFCAITYRSLKEGEGVLLNQILLKLSIGLSGFVELVWFRIRGLHVLFFFVSSVLWFREGLADFRYDGVNIGEKLSPELVAGMLWKIFFYMDFWYHLTLSLTNSKRIDYKWKYIINLSFLLILSGTTSAMYFLIHFIFVFFPSFFVKTIKVSFLNLVKTKPLNLIKVVTSFFLFVVLILYAYHVGETIKTGRELSVEERFQSSGAAEELKLFFVQRFSTTLYAHTYILEEKEYEINDYINHMNIPIDNFFYRTDLVLGRPFNVEKPEMASINRLNYINVLAFGHDETSGASPGLIPGFLYLFPTWLAIFISAFVLGAISILINFCIKRATFLYAAVTMLLVLDLFKALTIALNPLSTTFFQIFFFFGLVGLLYKNNRLNLLNNM